MSSKLKLGLGLGSKNLDPIQPLVLPEVNISGEQQHAEKKPDFLPCLFCDREFTVLKTENHILKHLLTSHKFVIADINLVADQPRYFQYWKQRLSDKPVTDFCSVIKTNTDAKDIQPSEFYYLLCDLLPEDKQLREKLQAERLQIVLKDQEDERNDALFEKGCLFCKKHFTGNRSELFTHMKEDHAFNIGHPDNLVYVSEFLAILESKLNNLQCLFCERIFKTWEILKEHMRKKQHRKLNPQNSSFDKFYLINYLELGKNWESIQDDRDIIKEEEDWNDWLETSNSGAVCLFCKYASIDIELLCNHMLEEHEFNFARLKNKLRLNFYQQIKLINYIRRQINSLKCVSCKETFDSHSDLLSHMTIKQHFEAIEDDSDWDQPQYFFPTYENDNLLFMLEDGGADDSQIIEGATVIPEDIQTIKGNEFLEDLRKELH